MKLINIGFGSMVAAGRFIDASYGRKTQAVLLMDTDHVILSALTPQTLLERWQNQEAKDIEEEAI